MHNSEYFQRIPEEFTRIINLYVEARALGQDDKVKGYLDQYYNLAFKHYENTNELIKGIQEIA